MDKKVNHNKDTGVDADNISDSAGVEKNSNSEELKTEKNDYGEHNAEKTASSQSGNAEKTVIINSTKIMNKTVEANDFDYTKHFKTTAEIRNQSENTEDSSEYEEDINKQIEQSLKKLTEDEVLLSREEYLSNEDTGADTDKRYQQNTSGIAEKSSNNVAASNSGKSADTNLKNTEHGKSTGKSPETSVKKPFYKNIKFIIPAIAALAGVVVLIIVINLNNNSYNSTYKKGEQAYANGEYEKALEYYLKASNSNDGKRNTDMLLHMADAYFRLEKYDDSIAVYNQVLNIDEKNGKAVAGLLENYTKKKDIDNINAVLRKYENSGMDEYIAPYDVTAPKASVDSGSYDDSQSVKFTSDDGTTIYYTLDGNDPSDKSKIYTRPITVNEGYTVISVVAYNSEGVRSKIATYEYNIDYMIPDAPSVSLGDGKYVSGTSVSISVPEGSTVYYTTDGSDPTKDSTKYEKEISLPMGHTKLSVVAINDKSGKSSDIVRREYDIVAYGQNASDNSTVNTNGQNVTGNQSTSNN